MMVERQVGGVLGHADDQLRGRIRPTAAERLVVGEDPARLGDQELAGGGGPATPPVALQERFADDRLEATDVWLTADSVSARLAAAR